MSIIVWNITLLPDKDQNNAIQEVCIKKGAMKAGVEAYPY